jgi:RNA polymerase sigma-70 factor, ECF subfamily
MNGANYSEFANVDITGRETTQDSEIVAAARAGSPEAFAELYLIYSTRLYRTIFGITKSPEDAEDALQDTFLSASLAIRAFEGRGSVYSWLTRIAINSALLILRRRRARAELLFDPQPDICAETPRIEIRDPAPDPEQICDLRQRRMRLKRAIRNLNAPLREPIRMWVANESSMKEISRSLNISEAAVKTRLHRARVQLSATSMNS